MNQKLPFSYSTRWKRHRITELYTKQDGKCTYCKKNMWLPWSIDLLFDWTAGELEEHNHNTHSNFKSRATLEYLIPICKGGSKRRRRNLACSCSECNGKRGNLSHRVFQIVHRSKLLYELTMEMRKMYYSISKVRSNKRKCRAFS